MHPRSPEASPLGGIGVLFAFSSPNTIYSIKTAEGNRIIMDADEQSLEHHQKIIYFEVSFRGSEFMTFPERETWSITFFFKIFRYENKQECP
jgi:hypothetical protein